MRNELNKSSHLQEGNPLLGMIPLRTEADIRKKRQKLIYDQKERQKKLIEYILIGLLVFIMGGALIGFLMLLKGTGHI